MTDAVAVGLMCGVSFLVGYVLGRRRDPLREANKALRYSAGWSRGTAPGEHRARSSETSPGAGVLRGER